MRGGEGAHYRAPNQAPLMLRPAAGGAAPPRRLCVLVEGTPEWHSLVSDKTASVQLSTPVSWVKACDEQRNNPCAGFSSVTTSHHKTAQSSPACYAALSHTTNRRLPCPLLPPHSPAAPTAPHVNFGQTGFYRVCYSPELLAALGPRMPSLPASDRAGLVSDAFALASAGYQRTTVALSLLREHFAKETDYVVWANLASGLSVRAAGFSARCCPIQQQHLSRTPALAAAGAHVRVVCGTRGRCEGPRALLRVPVRAARGSARLGAQGVRAWGCGWGLGNARPCIQREADWEKSYSCACSCGADGIVRMDDDDEMAGS